MAYSLLLNNTVTLQASCIIVFPINSLIFALITEAIIYYFNEPENTDSRLVSIANLFVHTFCSTVMKNEQ